MMKIVLFSRVPRWYSFKNERLVSRLTKDGHEVVGVIVERTPTMRSLSEWTHKLGWKVFLRKTKGKLFNNGSIANGNAESSYFPTVSPKVHFIKSHNSKECAEILDRLSPDLVVLRGCGIIKSEILKIPRIGVINPHYAKLPDFRGMDVTEWTVLCGEEPAVSVHTVDAGVDTGVVLRSDVIEATNSDETGNLRDKSAARVVDLIAEVVSDLDNGMEWPNSAADSREGRQFFVMHDRLRKLANVKLQKRERVA